MSNDSVKETASYGRRAASYWSVDGTPEILRGLVLIILGALAFLLRVYAPKPWMRFDFQIEFVGLILYVFLVERVALDSLKSRFTYPRTGYVQPPEALYLRSRAPFPLSLRPGPPFRPSYFSPSAEENATSFWPRTVRPLLAFLLLCWVSADLLGHWLMPLAIPALAVTLYVANQNSERPYPWWSALALALTGPVFLWVDVPVPLQWLLAFPLVGAWLLAQGVYTLVDYLRANPYPRAAEGVKA